MPNNRGRRDTSKFESISGYVPKPLGKEFKIDCMRRDQTIAEALEEMIRDRLAAQGVQNIDGILKAGIERVKREWVSDEGLIDLAHDTGLDLETWKEVRDCYHSRRMNQDVHH